MGPTEMRALSAADEDVLWEMLFYASHSEEEAGSSVEGVKANPGLARYVAGWGAAFDFGYVARASEVVGACWARRLTGDGRGYGWVDDETPELAIAIGPGGRGNGMGTRLLQ